MRRLSTFLFVLCCGTSVQGARAQSSAAPPATSDVALPAEYERAVDQAFKEFELGNYLEARARFLEANSLLPNARSLRALGIVEYELRNYVRCIEYLQQALNDPRRPLAAEEREESQRMIAQARGYVARYTIHTQPADAALELDAAPVVLGPDRSLLLQVGDHVLEARAPGYVPVRRDLHVLGPGEVNLAIRLESLESSSRESESRPLRKTWWLWASVGAAVVAGAVIATVAATNRPADERVLAGTTGWIVSPPAKQ